MELKPVEIKKASEEIARGEGQTPFGKIVKCDDFCGRTNLNYTGSST
jgi:hypothetical protein